jgi:hypothetical protein
MGTKWMRLAGMWMIAGMFAGCSSHQSASTTVNQSGNVPTGDPNLGNANVGYLPNPSQQYDEVAGYIAPPPRSLSCQQSQSAILSANQTLSLNFSVTGGSASSGTMTFVISSQDSSVPAGTNLGTVTQSGPLTAYYTAPPSVAQSFSVAISASESSNDSVTNSPCTILLLQDGDLGVADNGYTQGVVGNVYSLPVNTPDLVNPATMTPVATLLTPNLNVPNHAWTEGFPGLPASFIAWFEIDFTGQIYFPEDGEYQFRTDSDDGSIVFVNGQQVVNNDGVHAITTVIGPTMYFSQGWYTFEEWYYQGPPVMIADMVYWRCVSDSNADNWSIIPPDALARPNANPTN